MAKLTVEEHLVFDIAFALRSELLSFPAGKHDDQSTPSASLVSCSI